MARLIFRLLTFIGLLSLAVQAAENSSCGLTVNDNFSAYACAPAADETQEVVIRGIYKASNSFTCSVMSGGAEGVAQNVKAKNCTAPTVTSDAYLKNAAATIAKETSIILGRPVPPSVYDMSGKLSSVNQWIQDRRADNGQRGLSLAGLEKIDSHSNYEGTVPSLLVGVLTLDGDYFNHNSKGATYINSVGEVDLNPEYLSVSQKEIENHNLNALGNLVKDGIDWVFGEVNDRQSPDENGAAVFNPMGFMDKQVLGFYVYLVSNLMAGYMDIVYLLFMLGTMWAFGIYGYKKYLDKVTNANEFSVNKLSYLMTVAMGFAFFTAPVIQEDVDTGGALSRAIYRDDNGHDTSDYYGYSTLAQQSIRYAAQLGTYFANLESDYAMQAFYAFLEFKQGMFQSPHEVGRKMSENMRSVNADIYKASLAANYLDKVCRPYFTVHGGTFNFSKVQAENMNNSKNTAALVAAGITGADRISVHECIDASRTVASLANKIIAEKKSIEKEMETYESLFKGGTGGYMRDGAIMGDTTDQDRFKDFMNMLTWTQNTFGWLTSVSPHSAHMFFKYVNVYEYQADEDIQSQYFVTAMDNYVEAEGGTHEGVARQVGNATEEAVGTVMGVVISNSVWLMVPGFQGAMDFFEKQLSKVAFKGETGAMTGFDPYHALTGILKKIPLVGAGIGHVVDGTVKLINKMSGDSGEYIMVQTVISIASFLLAMIVISMVIATATIMIITVFVTFKIVMYFIELIIFFVSAPIVGIYATAISKEPQKYMDNFMKHLGMLLVTPLTIVTASYIVLPVTELFKGLFSALVMLVFRIFDKGEDLLNQDVPLTSVMDSTKKIVALSAMNGMAEIFAMIAVIFISYIIIFNFKDWFAKIVGLDGVSETTKAALSEMKQSSQKYISPL